MSTGAIMPSLVSRPNSMRAAVGLAAVVVNSTMPTVGMVLLTDGVTSNVQLPVGGIPPEPAAGGVPAVLEPPVSPAGGAPPIAALPPEPPVPGALPPLPPLPPLLGIPPVPIPPFPPDGAIIMPPDPGLAPPLAPPLPLGAPELPPGGVEGGVPESSLQARLLENIKGGSSNNFLAGPSFIRFPFARLGWSVCTIGTQRRLADGLEREARILDSAHALGLDRQAVGGVVRGTR